MPASIDDGESAQWASSLSPRPLSAHPNCASRPRSAPAPPAATQLPLRVHETALDPVAQSAVEKSNAVDDSKAAAKAVFTAIDERRAYVIAAMKVIY